MKLMLLDINRRLSSIAEQEYEFIRSFKIDDIDWTIKSNKTKFELSRDGSVLTCEKAIYKINNYECTGFGREYEGWSKIHEILMKDGFVDDSNIKEIGKSISEAGVQEYDNARINVKNSGYKLLAVPMAKNNCLIFQCVDANHRTYTDRYGQYPADDYEIYQVSITFD